MEKINKKKVIKFKETDYVLSEKGEGWEKKKW
jgi:hypothetical protein